MTVPSTARQRLSALVVLGFAVLLTGLVDPAEADARRRVPVPRFVGPSTLEIRGTDHARRLRWVEFGTRRVQLAWRVSAGRHRCRVALRVTDRQGDLVARDVVRVRAHRYRHPRREIAVRHVSGRIAVRSSCPRYRVLLRAKPQPRLPISVRVVHFRVDGAGHRRVWRSVRTQGPRGWAALTQWRTRSGCGPVTVKVWLPRWRAPKRAPDWLEARFDRFYRGLRIHELGHVTLVKQMVGRGKGCVNRAGWRKVSRRSDRYDRLTHHGRTQGARWY